MRGDDRAHRRVVVVQHRLHLLRLGGVGERGEAAQVDEHVADLAAMQREDGVLAGGDDGIGDRRREEALQLAQPVELRDLLGDALLELGVPLLQRSAWRRRPRPAAPSPAAASAPGRTARPG